jgi:aspartate carbamoyltransferase regulatory subunit
MYNITETNPGHIEITCKNLQKYTRTTEFVMFCANPNCICEKESKLHIAELRKMMKLFSENNSQFSLKLIKNG